MISETGLDSDAGWASRHRARLEQQNAALYVYFDFIFAIGTTASVAFSANGSTGGVASTWRPPLSHRHLGSLLLRWPTFLALPGWIADGAGAR